LNNLASRFSVAIAPDEEPTERVGLRL